MNTFFEHCISLMAWDIDLNKPMPIGHQYSCHLIHRRASKKHSACSVSGLSYALGRMITYLAIGIFVVAGVLSIPFISNFLQQYINRLLGPIFIITGMFLLKFLQFTISGSLVNGKIQRRAERAGFLNAGILGITFSLSFCPVSAALFFGSLIPLAEKNQSKIYNGPHL